MRRFFACLLLLVVAASGCAPPERFEFPDVRSWQDLPPVSGYLAQDALWQGQVLLAGDLVVPPGRKLVIAPGTTVFVRPSESTKIDPEWFSPQTELVVRGTLQIGGSPGHPVRFLPTHLPEKEETAWAGLIFDAAEGGVLAGTEVFYAETGLWIVDSSPQIRDSRFWHCRYGAVIQRQGRPLLQGNRFENGEGGVFCWWGARPTLVENLIVGNEEEGLFIDGDSQPRLLRNRITGNGIGVAAKEPITDDRARLEKNAVDFRSLETQKEKR